MKRLKTMQNDENGSALVITMMVLVVLSLLGASLGTVTLGSLQLGDNSRDYNSAYYIAEAGANLAYDDIQSAVNDIYQASNSQHDYYQVNIPTLINEVNAKDYSTGNFNEQFGAQPTVTVEMTEIDQGNYTIQATGEINGKKRIVEKPVVFNWEEKNAPVIFPEDAAIIFEESITFHPSDKYTVDGNILTSKKNYNHSDVLFDELVKFGEYEQAVNDLVSQNYVTGNQFEVNNNLAIIDENTYFEEININNNLEIDTNGNDIFIKVDDLTLTANIKVIGEGSVNFYITNELTLSTNANKNIHLDNIDLIYAGDQEVSIHTNTNISTTIIALNAEVIVGNNSNYKGTIIAKHVTLGNGAHISYQDTGNDFGGNGLEIVTTGQLIDTKPAIEN